MAAVVHVSLAKHTQHERLQLALHPCHTTRIVPHHVTTHPRPWRSTQALSTDGDTGHALHDVHGECMVHNTRVLWRGEEGKGGAGSGGAPGHHVAPRDSTRGRGRGRRVTQCTPHQFGPSHHTTPPPASSLASMQPPSHSITAGGCYSPHQDTRILPHPPHTTRMLPHTNTQQTSTDSALDILRTCARMHACAPRRVHPPLCTPWARAHTLPPTCGRPCSSMVSTSPRTASCTCSIMARAASLAWGAEGGEVAGAGNKGSGGAEVERRGAVVDRDAGDKREAGG